MSAELPPEIVVIEQDGATRYVLPRPALDMRRLMGGILIAFGLFPIGMGAWFIHQVAAHFGPANNAHAVGEALSLLCPSFFILFGGLISLLGVWGLAGHTEVVMAPGEIGAAFRLGPLAWWGRRPLRKVRRLVVERLSRGPGPGAEMASLLAETDAGRPLVLALAQPPAMLALLASDLARRSDTGEGPLPVVERAAGQASSRRWRRNLPAAAKQEVPGCMWFVWGTGFFASGIFAFAMFLQALLRGDPDRSLQGAYPWKWLWVLFPFLFIIPGAGALLHAFDRWRKAGLSPEQAKTAEVKRPAPTDEAGGLAPARTPPEVEYPTVPARSRAPGAELAARLAPADSPGCAVVGLLVVLVLCSGVLTPLARSAVRALRGGHWEWGLGPAIFATMLAFAWVLVAGALTRAYRQWRFGCPVVEVSALPVYCGDTCEMVVTVAGPATLPRLRVAVICEEEASYSEGDDTRKETRLVYEKELASRENFAIERGEPLRVRGTFHIPAGAMHSFKAAHNEVRWVVRVEGEARPLFRLPFKYDYGLEVRPPRQPGGTT